MNEYKKRYELKNQAKDRLTGNYRSAILFLLTSGILRLCISLVSDITIPFRNVAGTIIGVILSYAVSVLLSVLDIGVAYFYLKLSCNQPLRMADLFYGFKEQPNKCLAVAASICGLSFLFHIPARVFSYLLDGGFFPALALYGVPTLAWELLASLVCDLLFLPLSLALSQSYFLIADYPSLGAMDTLKMSMKIMKGQKWRLFVLQLSFIPLLILASFTCCSLGVLWVYPYMQMTYTFFYLDLMNGPAKSHTQN